MFARVIELVMSGRERRALVLSLSLAIPVVVCSLSASMRDWMSTTSAALVLVLCVVVAGTSGQRIAALLAAVSSGISFDYFLTRPYYSLVISDPDDVEVTVLLIFIGVMVTEATMWGLRQESRAAGGGRREPGHGARPQEAQALGAGAQGVSGRRRRAADRRRLR